MSTHREPARPAPRLGAFVIESKLPPHELPCFAIILWDETGQLPERIQTVIRHAQESGPAFWHRVQDIAYAGHANRGGNRMWKWRAGAIGFYRGMTNDAVTDAYRNSKAHYKWLANPIRSNGDTRVWALAQLGKLCGWLPKDYKA